LGEETRHKYVKVAVVSLANASSQPQTVVVEVQHTIIACVAMSSAWGPEYEASLAKLHFEECCSM
jgi:hypothetical protein